MTRDRTPHGTPYDFTLPADRVPREPASVRVVLLATALAFGVFGLFLWALPDLAAWASTWSIGR
jgi:hypothetical protein